MRARLDGNANHSAAPIVGLQARTNPHAGRSAPPIIKAGHCERRTVVMNAGAVIARGTPRAVLSDPEVVRAYLGSDDA